MNGLKFNGAKNGVNNNSIAATNYNSPRIVKQLESNLAEKLLKPAHKRRTEHFAPFTPDRPVILLGKLDLSSQAISHYAKKAKCTQSESNENALKVVTGTDSKVDDVPITAKPRRSARRKFTTNHTSMNSNIRLLIDDARFECSPIYQLLSEVNREKNEMQTVASNTRKDVEIHSTSIETVNAPIDASDKMEMDDGFEEPQMAELSIAETGFMCDACGTNVDIGMNRTESGSQPSNIETAEEEDDLNFTLRSASEQNLGEIVWASLARYSFWPAMICVDGNEESENAHSFHVVFLGDRSRSAWVLKKNVLRNTSCREYHALCENMFKNTDAKIRRSEMKRLKKLYKIPEQSSAWCQAIAELKLMEQIRIEYRLYFYNTILFPEICNMKSDKSVLKTNANPLIKDRKATSTPCTSDTAYSSMKQSPSPESSFGFDEDYDNLIKVNRITSFLDSLDDADDITGHDLASTPSECKDHSQNSQTSTNSLSDASTSITFWGDTLREEMTALVKTDGFLIENNHMEFNLAAAHIRNVYCSSRSSTGTRKPKSSCAKSEKSLESAVASKRAEKSLSRRQLSLSKKQLREVPAAVVKKPTDESIKKRTIEREKVLKQREELIGDYILKKQYANFILKDAPKENVCDICLRSNDVFRCSGNCGGHFHRGCADNDIEFNDGCGPEKWYADYKTRVQIEKPVTIDLVTGDDFISPSTLINNSTDARAIVCGSCKSKRTPRCFVCMQDDGKQIQCSEKQCGRAYHLACLKYWPQHKLQFSGQNVKSILCPRHVCHTCISDNPQMLFTNVEGSKKLIRCALCPGTYHRVSTCIPAGSEILSESQLVCPRHRSNKRKPVNIDWCFLCSKSGSLLCCETCPGSFHQDCLKIQCSDRYVCEECESGRLPLYGEIVWSKYNRCKHWWPGILVAPPMIPEIVAEQKPGANYICIYFFGEYNYGWLCRDYIYLYDEGDVHCTVPHGSDKNLPRAWEDAKKWYPIIKGTLPRYSRPKQQIAKPSAYTKIRSNHFVAPVKFEMHAEDMENKCSCKRTDPSPCGPQSDCINYELLIECSSSCQAGELCENQRFEKRQYIQYELRNLGSKGFGMVALQDIPSNTFIIEYVGEVINAATFQQRHDQAKQRKQENFYYLSLGNSLYIDAQFKGNAARFINHSCDPNCVPKKWVVNGQTRIGLFSQKEIPQGTELTFDYKWDDLCGNKTVCHCGATNCSGYIGFKLKHKTESSAVPARKTCSGSIDIKSKPIAKRKMKDESTTGLPKKIRSSNFN